MLFSLNVNILLYNMRARQLPDVTCQRHVCPYAHDFICSNVNLRLFDMLGASFRASEPRKTDNIDSINLTHTNCSLT